MKHEIRNPKSPGDGTGETISNFQNTKHKQPIALSLSKIPASITAPHINKLKHIYTEMDREYQAAAKHYALTCSGCMDNCCYTRFYHHTLAELLCLAEGLMTLERKVREEIESRAQDVCEKTEALDRQGKPVRLLCPLNVEERCVLYNYRPMICRLHGVPNELSRPGQGVIYSPGCETGTSLFEEKGYYQFDRTPLYIEMVKAEKGLREVSGYQEKMKMTVAEMILYLSA